MILAFDRQRSYICVFSTLEKAMVVNAFIVKSEPCNHIIQLINYNVSKIFSNVFISKKKCTDCICIRCILLLVVVIMLVIKIIVLIFLYGLSINSQFCPIAIYKRSLLTILVKKMRSTVSYFRKWDL